MKVQYVKSERTHFMCPNMFFGMIVELDKEYNKDLVDNALFALADAHPFLKSVIAYENDTDKLFYNVTNVSQIQLKIQQADTLWEDYSELSDKEWDVFNNGLLKVYVYTSNENIKLLFVFHHLLVDGRGALQIVEEFSDYYMENKKPQYVEEQLLQSIDELSNGNQLSGISSLLVKSANKKWKKENKKVSYKQYSDFVEQYSKTKKVEHKIYHLDKDAVSDMLELCHQNGFTMNDLLMAHLYNKTNTDKIIIATDIRNKFKNYKVGSLGNFATAMGIVYKKKKSDIIDIAKDIHIIVKKQSENYNSLYLVLACFLELDETLQDASAISSLGGFESKAAKFVGKNMFHMDSASKYSITNLGRIENKNIKTCCFIPPASPAVHFILGVLTVNGVMNICSSKNSIK